MDFKNDFYIVGNLQLKMSNLTKTTKSSSLSKGLIGSAEILQQPTLFLDVALRLISDHPGRQNEFLVDNY